jgi:hypothetical protein
VLSNSNGQFFAHHAIGYKPPFNVTLYGNLNDAFLYVVVWIKSSLKYFVTRMSSNPSLLPAQVVVDVILDALKKISSLIPAKAS